MRSRRNCVLLLLGVVWLTGCRSRPGAGDELWAKVNGQPIYRSQVEKYYERQVSTLPEPLAADEALARKLSILNGLIQNEILWQKAAQASLLASDAEVEARIQELRARFAEEEFQRQLDAQGMTLDDLKVDLRREIAIRKLLDLRVGAGIEVSEQEVADYYQQYKNRFRFVETQYRVARILVTPRRDPEVGNLRNDDAVTETQARRKTQLILERLRAGDDFAELARNYSEDPLTALTGGDLGFFPESALADSHPALRNQLERLEVGQIAGPIRTQKGYELVKLLEREPPGQRRLSDPGVQEAIRERLQRQKRQLLEAAYVEEARNQARVVNYLARQLLEARRSAPSQRSD